MNVRKFQSIETDNIRIVHDLESKKITLWIQCENNFEMIGSYDSYKEMNKIVDVIMDELSTIRKSDL